MVQGVKHVVSYSSSSSSSSSTSSSYTSSSSTDTGTDTSVDTTTDTSDDSSSTSSSSYTEVPVETYEEALEFANREWAKIKRGNGHSLEVKVLGSEKYRPGEWVKVYIPRFELDMYMYITKVSQSEDTNGDWSANLKLVDYPPSFGEYKQESDDDSEDTDDTEDTEDTEDTTTTT